MTAARPKSKAVLFIGTGNHDRSRVAEILFSAVASKMGLPWTATSRGTAAKQPAKKEGPMAAASLKALQARGLRTEGFARSPAQLTDADLENADIVIALDRAEHEPLIAERFPAWAASVEYWQLPPGGDPVAPIEREVSNLVARLLGGRPSDESPPEPAPPGRAPKPATVRVGRETKGRKGKGVTTITDLPLDEAALKDLAAHLKGRCGTGGTVKDGRIEIQGDNRDRVAAELEKLGYRVKRSGG